jgi:hypothetical protein
MQEQIKKALEHLTEEIPELKPEVKESHTKWIEKCNTAEHRGLKSEDIKFCPWTGFGSSVYDAVCPFYTTTGKKPTKLDCYICRQ